MDKEYTINCKQDETVLDALRRQGIMIRAFCNGRHTCGKCRIILDEENMTEPSYEEMYLLTDEENAMGARLACFVKPASDDVEDLKVTILDMLESEAPVLTGTDELSMSFSMGDMSFVAIDIGVFLTTVIPAEICTIKLIASKKIPVWKFILYLVGYCIYCVDIVFGVLVHREFKKAEVDQIAVS